MDAKRLALLEPFISHKASLVDTILRLTLLFLKRVVFADIDPTSNIVHRGCDVHTLIHSSIHAEI